MPAILAAVAGCSFSITDVEDLPRSQEPPQPEQSYFIEDLTGRQWDITYAIVELGFNIDRFSDSKGPYVRPPLVDPEMVTAGHRSYPPEDATVRVLGTTARGESRAYAISVFERYEVVDDRVGQVHFAVAY